MMKNETIRNKWSEFINQYSKYSEILNKIKTKKSIIG